MNNNVKEVAQAFTKSGIIGKILITFSIFLVLFLLVFVWYNIQNNKLIVSIEALIQNQARLDVFKRCIKDAYDDGMVEYNQELLPVLGTILQEHGIAFPQKLNTSILKFQTKMNRIQDCLIFPEDNK